MNEIISTLGLDEFACLLELAKKNDFSKKKKTPFATRIMTAFIICLAVCMAMFLFQDVIIVVASILSRRVFTDTEKIGVFIKLFIFIVVLLAILEISTFNFKKIKLYKDFLSSAWWKNTGKLPSEILSDAGIYGEFIATMTVESYLKQRTETYMIFNNVLIPKKDGDYTEIDLLYVDVYGVHVIEVKNWSGMVSGNMVDENWEHTVGTEVHIEKNPFYQNQNHVNYITEYLASNDERFKGTLIEGNELESTIINFVFNEVMFIKNLNYKVNTYVPVANTYLFCSQFGYDFVKVYPQDQLLNQISFKDINRIINIISKLKYTENERLNIMQNMAIYRQQKVFMHKCIYKVQKIAFAPVKTLPSGEFEIYAYYYVICKENEYYKTYRFTPDGWYRSIPGATVLNEYGQFYSEEDALRMFIKIQAEQQ